MKLKQKWKSIGNEWQDKSCWHNASTIRFAGRRTAFYFCFAPIIDEPCRCFCLTNGRCLCDLALFALHPFTSLRIALRSQCLFSFFFFFFLLLFVVIYTADALIKESPNRRLLRAAFFCKASFSFPFRSPSLRRFYLYLRHGLSVSLVSSRITNNSISIIHKLNEEC